MCRVVGECKRPLESLDSHYTDVLRRRPPNSGVTAAQRIVCPSCDPTAIPKSIFQVHHSCLGIRLGPPVFRRLAFDVWFLEELCLDMSGDMFGQSGTIRLDGGVEQSYGFGGEVSWEV